MTDPSAPPAWLVASIFAGGICLFIGFLYLVQAIKRAGQWLNGERPSRAARLTRSRVMTVRRRNGQFRGSVSAVPNGNGRSEVVSAPERAVSDHRSVPSLSLSVPDIARISYHLGQGMAVSDVAKVLPGYSSRNYKEYAEKVRHVQELLKQAEADRPLDAPPAPPERHEAQPKLGVV